MKKVKVLFVCLGNICRSPLAEAIFNHKIATMGLQHIVMADSCGTANYHVGDSPDPRTIANAKRNGVMIEHIGQQLSSEHFEEFDFILAMDKSNYENILKLAGASGYAQKVSLMRSFEAEGSHLEVPDPYYGNEKDFQRVFDILDNSMEHFIQHLENTSGLKQHL
ncbi:MAG: low molecular weight protein-tyrosine-phosphatase [Cyclobacteriaceae bacterium]